MGCGPGSDTGFYFVGKLLERPLRTRMEELEFCYGNYQLSEDEDDYDNVTHTLDPSDSSSIIAKAKIPKKNKKVRFEWLPQDVSERVARLYLNQIPESSVPIAGSEGAHFRQQVFKHVQAVFMQQVNYKFY